MAERFTLYLDGDDAAWLNAQGELVRAPVSDAASAAGERETVVLIPAEHVLITSVQLPPIRQTRRRLQAASFALEDQLAARVDSLHFALAARAEADGDTPVVVIDHLHMQEVLQACESAKLNVVHVQPDVLALPSPQADTWQMAMIGDRVLTRSAGRRGFAAERDLWPTLSEGQTPPARIVLQGTHPDDMGIRSLITDAGFEPPPEVEFRAFNDSDAVLAQLLQTVDPGGAINLRQGAFTRASAMQSWWQPLKITAGLAAAWLVLALGARAIENWQLNQRIDALEAESVSAFRDAFPNVQTINDLRVQAEQNIRSLRGSGASGGLFPLLQATAEVTGQAGSVKVQSMQYRDGALSLSLRGDNVQSIEALRAGFARQRDAKLNVESADAASDGVQISASVTAGAGA